MIAVIADIVGSRKLADREGAQREIENAIARAQRTLPVADRMLAATVGDELQGVYLALGDALASLLLVQLELPDPISCRFGIGIGAVRTVRSGEGEIPEGPGWWAAREAIDLVHTKQQRTAPTARTWIVAAPEEDGRMHDAVRLANAYLLARDQLVGTMSERTRRLVAGRCARLTQRELAEREGITQSAVSQALTTAGAAAVVEGFHALGAGVPR
jgi:hypothetical protein